MTYKYNSSHTKYNLNYVILPELYIENPQSSWCQLCLHGRHRQISSDNHWCRHWQWSWHYDDSQFSVYNTSKEYALGWCFIQICVEPCQIIYPYPSGLLHRNWNNHAIAPVPAKQYWRVCTDQWNIRIYQQSKYNENKRNHNKFVCISHGIFRSGH